MSIVYAAEEVEEEEEATTSTNALIYSCHSVFYWASVLVMAEACDPVL